MVNAEYGEAVDFADASATVSTMCNANLTSCLLDITKFAGYNDTPGGKILRVEWTCVCMEGYMNIANATTGACQPCPAGSTKSLGDLDCSRCRPGTYQDLEGQARGGASSLCMRREPSAWARHKVGGTL